MGEIAGKVDRGAEAAGGRKQLWLRPQPGVWAGASAAT